MTVKRDFLLDDHQVRWLLGSSGPSLSSVCWSAETLEDGVGVRHPRAEPVSHLP